MSVLEVSELIKMMEEKFGVSAAAAAVAVAAPAGGAAAPAEEKSEFDVVLKEIGANKVQVIKAYTARLRIWSLVFFLSENFEWVIEYDPAKVFCRSII